MAMKTDGIGYELTDNLGLWKDEDIISFVLDTETIMGVEKHQIALFAQELAIRLDEAVEKVHYAEDFLGTEYNG